MATTNNIGTLTMNMMVDARRFHQQITNVQNNVVVMVNHVQQQTQQMGETISSSLASVGMALQRSLTGPLVEFSSAAVMAGNSFELAMSRITGLVNIPKEQVAAWSEDIKLLSTRLGKAPEELAKGMYFVTTAGQRGAQALDVLTQSARASAAGLGTVDKVADAITSAINAYGKETLSATRATEILVAAVREGKFEASGLAAVVGRTLPLAKAMGVDFAEVGGAIAAMTKIGATVQQAGVQLTAFLGGLNKPTKEAVEVLNSYGISVTRLQHMITQPGGIMKTIRFLNESFKGNTQVWGQVFSDLRELRGVLNLMSQDAKAVDSMFSGVRESVGILDTATKAMEETQAFKFQQAWAGAKTALVEAGMAIAGVLVPAMQTLTVLLADTVKWIQGLSSTTKSFIVYVGLAAAAIGPLLVALAGLIKLIKFVAPVVIAIKTFAASAKVAATASAALTGAMTFAGPVAGILALVAATTLLVDVAMGGSKAWRQFHDEMKKSAGLSDQLNKAKDASFKTFSESVGGMNPLDQISKLEERLASAKKNLEGANKSVAGQQAKIARMEGGGRSALAAIPLIGRGRWMEIETEKSLLTETEKTAARAAKEVAELTQRLESARRAAKSSPFRPEDTLTPMVDALNDKLLRQFEIFGMTNREVALYDVQMAGATEEQLKFANVTNDYLDVLEKQRKLTREAEEAVKKARTPQDTFKATVKELDDALYHGAISVEDYAKAFAHAKTEAMGLNKELQKFDGASSQSAEAMSRLVQWTERMAIPKPDVAAAIARRKQLGSAEVNAQVAFMDEVFGEAKHAPPGVEELKEVGKILGGAFANLPTMGQRKAGALPGLGAITGSGVVSGIKQTSDKWRSWFVDPVFGMNRDLMAPDHPALKVYKDLTNTPWDKMLGWLEKIAKTNEDMSKKEGVELSPSEIGR